MNELDQEMLREYSGKNWCFALHGNHDEHQCHKKPGHQKRSKALYGDPHQCYCGVWW